VPGPLAWKKVFSTVLVVRSVMLVKLTGMPCNGRGDLLPVPQATEWSVFVVVTVTVVVPRPVQVSICCCLPALPQGIAPSLTQPSPIRVSGRQRGRSRDVLLGAHDQTCGSRR